MRWSISAHNAVRRCERQAFYAYAIASHAARDPLRREAYILKQLQQPATWRGHIVHDVLATDFAPRLRQRSWRVDVDALTARAAALARKQWAFSSEGRYRDGAPKAAHGRAYAALFIHEYEAAGALDVADTVDEITEVARQCFTNLARQESLLRELARADQIETERPVVANLAGASVTAVPDLVAIHPGPSWTVIDWKIAASQTSSYSRQLLVYALVILTTRTFGVRDFARLRLLEVNLLQGDVREIAVDDDVLAETEDFIYRSAHDLQALMADGAGQSLEGRLADCEIASSPGTCATCNFRRLCTAAIVPSREPAKPIQGMLL